MFKELVSLFSYTFLQHALIVGLLVSLCASLLGTSLVLRRYSMIGDGLSHVGFGALAVATALHASPMGVTIPLVILAAFLLLRISERSSIGGDAAIALISTAALALGIMVLSFSDGANKDLNGFLFGSILSISHEDMRLAVVLCSAVLLLFFFFYNKIFALTFDEEFARAIGLPVPVYNMLTAAQTAVIIVLGMRMMGALLISSLIIFPSLTAMRLCTGFKSVTLVSVAVSICSFLLGLAVSALYSTPPGATVVLINAFAFLLFSFIRGVRNLAPLRKGK